MWSDKQAKKKNILLTLVHKPASENVTIINVLNVYEAAIYLNDVFVSESGAHFVSHLLSFCVREFVKSSELADRSITTPQTKISCCFFFLNHFLTPKSNTCVLILSAPAPPPTEFTLIKIHFRERLEDVKHLTD